MKKSLIALAVAGAMTAPMVAQADATLYGSFRAGLAFQDGADADLRDEASRVGIKGTVDLGLENTKGLFNWEASVNTADNGSAGNFGSRLAYLGATGDWGTALVGRQYHPHYTMVQSHTNIFNSADGEFGEAFSLSNKHHKREDNTLAYASPVMGGFQVVAGAVIASDGSDTNNNFDDEVDGYNIGAQFTGVEGLRVSAAYGKVEADIDATTSTLVADTTTGAISTVTTPGFDDYESELWGLGATYTIDAMTFAAKYEEREDTRNSATDEWKVWELAGIYQMGSTAFKARYGNLEFEDAFGKEDGDQWGVEVEHKLGQRGIVWVGYTDIDAEVAAGAEDTLVLGYRLDF